MARGRKIKSKNRLQSATQDACYQTCGGQPCGGGCEDVGGPSTVWCDCCDGVPYPGTDSGVECGGSSCNDLPPTDWAARGGFRNLRSKKYERASQTAVNLSMRQTGSKNKIKNPSQHELKQHRITTTSYTKSCSKKVLKVN